MESIAKALVHAVQYISECAEDRTIEDDVNALETLSSIIEKASTQEKKMLMRVATDLGFANWAEEMGIIIENDGK